MTSNRRDFLKTAAATAAGLAIVPSVSLQAKPIFKISLAQWSLNPLLFSGELDNLDFAKVSKEHGIEAIEYVNQFFMDKAEDMKYLKEMKMRADGEGVTSLLIMCDREGALGHPDEKERMQTVENHKKWVTAAKYLGCHTIRVNGYANADRNHVPDFDDDMKRVADGLHHLCVFADDHDISVVIENHGGLSSHGKWLAGVIKAADHPRAGTLPDFGNFRMNEMESYDSYRGVKELMPFATGVSVKPRVWDDDLNESDLDYEKMMRIVLDAGYRGYCGIEHGPRGAEWEGIMKVKKALMVARDALTEQYSE